jgi:signal transduction histidine kinase
MNSEARQTMWFDELPEEAMALLAHELRTPVQAIAGWALLLQRGALDSQQSGHAIETIVRTAALQARLIDDLLDRSRIRRGKMFLNMEPVDMAALVARVRRELFPVAHARGIEVDLRTGGAPCCVLGDSVRLEQVIRNLLTNAVKFSPNASRIDVVVTNASGKVRTSVSDSGIGIRGDVLPHVFDRFRCGSRDQEQRGLGLGLAIAHHIVELHGGSISAESCGEGRGARFSVVLPARDAADAAAE